MKAKCLREIMRMLGSKAEEEKKVLREAWDEEERRRKQEREDEQRQAGNGNATGAVTPTSLRSGTQIPKSALKRTVAEKTAGKSKRERDKSDATQA